MHPALVDGSTQLAGVKPAIEAVIGGVSSPPHVPVGADAIIINRLDRATTVLDCECRMMDVAEDVYADIVAGGPCGTGSRIHKLCFRSTGGVPKSTSDASMFNSYRLSWQVSTTPGQSMDAADIQVHGNSVAPMEIAQALSAFDHAEAGARVRLRVADGALRRGGRARRRSRSVVLADDGGVAVRG